MTKNSLQVDVGICRKRQKITMSEPSTSSINATLSGTCR